MAGQTLAIAGLVQTRIEASSNPDCLGSASCPILGAAFRNVKENRNEIELLIMVTPELVEPMDANEVPPCGPGSGTTSPNDWELFMKGHLEVPKCGPPCGSCNNGCPTEGGNMPPDGMMLDPAEPIPTPAPSGALRIVATAGLSSRPRRRNRQDSLRRQSTWHMGCAGANPYNRYSSPKPNSSSAPAPAETPNGPPGFIGPVGYDVVK